MYFVTSLYVIVTWRYFVYIHKSNDIQNLTFIHSIIYLHYHTFLLNWNEFTSLETKFIGNTVWIVYLMSCFDVFSNYLCTQYYFPRLTISWLKRSNYWKWVDSGINWTHVTEVRDGGSVREDVARGYILLARDWSSRS